MGRALGLLALFIQPGCTGTYVPTGGQGGAADVNGTPGATGLPCDVQSVMSANCWSCHGPTPSDGAPNALVTYDDLARPSVLDPTLSEAELAVMRMQGDPSPMPPGTMPTMSAADVDVVAAWIAAGMPRGDCIAPPPADGGASAADPFAAAPTCTSGTFYTGGTGGLMHPGQACVTCHLTNAAPDFLAAGTVYPTGHEPDDCNGTSEAVTVRITDAAGKVFERLVNSVGNFYVDPALGPMTFPIQVKVVAGGRERVMVSPQTSGDCNSCHTRDGTQGAPGRIVAP